MLQSFRRTRGERRGGRGTCIGTVQPRFVVTVAPHLVGNGCKVTAGKANDTIVVQVLLREETNRNWAPLSLRNAKKPLRLRAVAALEVKDTHDKCPGFAQGDVQSVVALHAARGGCLLVQQAISAPLPATRLFNPSLYQS